MSLLLDKIQGRFTLLTILPPGPAKSELGPGWTACWEQRI